MYAHNLICNLEQDQDQDLAVHYAEEGLLNDTLEEGLETAMPIQEEGADQDLDRDPERDAGMCLGSTITFQETGKENVIKTARGKEIGKENEKGTEDHHTTEGREVLTPKGREAVLEIDTGLENPEISVTEVRQGTSKEQSTVP